MARFCGVNIRMRLDKLAKIGGVIEAEGADVDADRKLIHYSEFFRSKIDSGALLVLLNY
jgi:hypothetical protein